MMHLRGGSALLTNQIAFMARNRHNHSFVVGGWMGFRRRGSMPRHHLWTPSPWGRYDLDPLVIVFFVDSVVDGGLGLAVGSWYDLVGNLIHVLH